jgi:hypothetical protein
MKLYIIKSTLILSLVSLVMSGCLKDKAYDDEQIQSTRPVGTPSVIELKLTATSTANFLTEAFPNSNNDTIVQILPVNLATANPAPEDINVTLSIDSSVVNKYNNDNGTAYAIPTSSMYTVVNPGNVVTIPKGSNTAYLQIKFKSAAFLGADWALGFKIASVDKPGYTISGNMNWSVVAIAVKNQWDGNYSATGYFQHPTSPRAINISGEDVITTGPNSVTKPLGDLGSGVLINMTINADNTVTITAGSGANPTTQGIPGGTTVNGVVYNNRYDPATKSFYLYYGYPYPSPTRIIYEKVTYVKSR